jgi:hypothetical protein
MYTGQQHVIEEFSAEFTPSFSFHQIKKCLAFTHYFGQMYVQNEGYLAGTAFTKVRDLIPQFEYVISHGVLDDPNGSEYTSGKETLENMKTAIESILKSNFIIVDTRVKDHMSDTYNIISRKKFRKNK